MLNDISVGADGTCAEMLYVYFEKAYLEEVKNRKELDSWED